MLAMKKLPLLLICLLPVPLFAANYYVTQSGAGSANGSSAANAWSVATFNASTVPAGGDIVTFSGTITSTVAPAKSGTGNGTGRLTLDFSGATLTGADPAIRISGKAYLNLNGGTLGSSATGTAVTFGGTQSHDITVQDWTQTNGDTSTASFIECTYCYNLVIANNKLTNMAHFIVGDSILNHDIRIANNSVSTGHNVTDQTDIIFLGDAYNVIIEGNKLLQQTEGATSGRHNDCMQTYMKGGGNAGHPYGWIIRYNWIELDVRTGSGDTSWLMLENMANSGGVDACKIYSNVFVGAATDDGSNNGMAPNSNDSSAVFRFYNNTVIRKNGPDNTIRFLAPGTLYAENNVGFATSGGGGTYLSWSMTQGRWDYNCFYNFGASSTYTGAHGSTADPKLSDVTNSVFTARDDTSPLRNKGDSTIGAEYAQGIAPTATWPNPQLVVRATAAWDIGAYQGGGAAVVPPSSATIDIQVK